MQKLKSGCKRKTTNGQPEIIALIGSERRHGLKAKRKGGHEPDNNRSLTL
jgi:hypothetical protein